MTRSRTSLKHKNPDRSAQLGRASLRSTLASTHHSRAQIGFDPTLVTGSRARIRPSRAPVRLRPALIRSSRALTLESHTSIATSPASIGESRVSTRKSRASIRKRHTPIQKRLTPIRKNRASIQDRSSASLGRSSVGRRQSSALHATVECKSTPIERTSPHPDDNAIRHRARLDTSRAPLIASRVHLGIARQTTGPPFGEPVALPGTTQRESSATRLPYAALTPAVESPST